MDDVSTTRPKLTTCLVCGGNYKASHFAALLKCEECGFISADMELSDAEVIKLYSRYYFEGAEYGNYHDDEDALKLNFEKRASELHAHIPNLSGCDLFEIGCAYGFFLDIVKPRVRRAAGIDISADAISHAQERGLLTESGDYLQITLPPQDVIVMWDTIEHLSRPDLFIEKAANDLKTGGFLALTTGDIGSLNARLRGRNWRMIHPPTHLHYFSVPTISRLLSRCGFDVVYVSHPGVARKVRSILYILFKLRWKQKRLYDVVQRWGVMDRAVSFNLYDIMFVIAKKRGQNI